MKSSEWMNKLNSQIVLGQWEVLLLSSELKGNDKERRLERWFRAWKYRVKTIFKQQEGRWANIRDGQRSEGAQRRRTAVGKPSILKSRDITSPTKVHLVKAMVFPVVMYGCESWMVKKAEHWRVDAFELWCWRRLLRVPWLQGDPTSPFWRRSVLGVLWKEWC